MESVLADALLAQSQDRWALLGALCRREASAERVEMLRFLPQRPEDQEARGSGGTRDGLLVLRDVLQCTMITHQILLRGAAQCCLLQTATDLVDVEKVSLSDVSTFLMSVRQEESLGQRTSLWTARQIEQEKWASMKKQDADNDKSDKEEKESSREKKGAVSDSKS
ncbi:hypothetical protein CB1_001108094 [Camelus ferus]|nr:hypothetical protein CB1_001108094 [Camelus ferus]